MSGPSTHHTQVEEHDATNAYQSLSETTEHDDPRWAFGSGIVEEEGAEITSPLPAGSTPPISPRTASCSATTR